MIVDDNQALEMLQKLSVLHEEDESERVVCLVALRQIGFSLVSLSDRLDGEYAAERSLLEENNFHVELCSGVGVKRCAGPLV